jgi:classical protein kinase C
MEGYQSLRGATPNQDVIRQAEAQIRDAQRNIEYLEESLRTLQGRRMSGGAPLRNQGMSTSSSGTAIQNPGFYNPSANARGPTDPMSDGRGGQGSNGPPSFVSSSGAHSSSYSGSNRSYPGDSSSSYLTSNNSDMQGGRRYDERRNQGGPGMGDGSRPGMQGGYGGQGYGGPPPPGKGGDLYGAPVNRAGTSARRNYTNLGEQNLYEMF